MGRGAAGATHPGPFLGADADRAVADGVVPLYLVALYLDAELERPGKPGVRDHSAVRRDLRLGGAGAGLLPGGLAAESPAGAAAGGHGFVANRGHLRPHL